MTKAIILTTQRSGSELLRSYLNSHPQIEALPEIIGHGAGYEEGGDCQAKVERLRQIWAEDSALIRIPKIMHYQIAGCPNVWDYFVQEEFKIVRLIRKDILSRARSVALNYEREKSGRSKSTYHHDQPELVSIEADLDWLVERMKWEQELFEYYDKKLDEVESMDLFYARDLVGVEGSEGMLIEPDASMQVCEFLGVPVRQLFNCDKTRKMNHPDWRESIKNHKEMIERFKQEGLI